MKTEYRSRTQESTQEKPINQTNGEMDPPTLADPISPLTPHYTREDLEGDDIQIEFTDDNELSLDDLTPADSISLALDTDEDRDDDEGDDLDTAIEWDDEAFPWPTVKPLSGVELHVWQKYALSPPPLQGADTPPPCFTLSSLVEWHATVESMISTATDLTLKTIDADEEDAAEQAYCILKTVKHMFRDLDTLIDVAWKVLENTQVAP